MCKISVLIPVYNTEKTLSKCLESVVNQTLKDIEIIITNDGSADNSEKIINYYYENYKNIKYTKQENKGLGATRNKGIEMAKGEYIAFLDSDDWVDLDYYEKMYKTAVKNSSDLVISSYKVEIKGIKKINTNKFNYINGDKNKYLFDLVSGEIAGFSWNKLYRNDLIKSNKLSFPVRGNFENVEDQYFSIRAVYCSKNIDFMNESNIHYFINKNSIVQKYQLTLINDILLLYRENKIYFRLDDTYNISMTENLIRSIVSIVNNEFKEDRRVAKHEKLSVIKSIYSHKEYYEVISCINLKKLNIKDKVYFILLRKKMIKTLYFIAQIRCKFINWRIRINV